MLCDSYKLRILNSMKKIPRSAYYISVMLNVPLSSIYKSLNELEKMALLERTGRFLTPEGVRVSYYRSWLEKIDLTLEEGEVIYRVLFRGGREEMIGKVCLPSRAGTKD